MILGIVLAGGKSRRFGSDKSAALLAGKSLLTHVAEALAPQCDKLLIVGKDGGDYAHIEDWPRAGLGPLGGIAAGLKYGAANGYDSVLSAPVDCPFLPENLAEILGTPPSFIGGQPVIGHWPCSALGAIEEILNGDGRHSMRAFAESVGAREIAHEGLGALININAPADLEAAKNTHG